MKRYSLVALFFIITKVQAQLTLGTYVSDKTKEILVVYHQDSVVILNPKTKKIYVKKEELFYVSVDSKDTLKISVVGDLDKDNYLGIRASDNPKRMFDFFDHSTRAPYNYFYFIKENLKGSYTCFETGHKIQIDLSKNLFLYQPSPKKNRPYKIYTIDYSNHKIIIWNDKKQKEDILFKLAFRNLVIEYKGNRYYLSE